MKVILLKTIKGLGEKGQTKDVSDGYARNFLLPKDMAIAATDSNLQKVQKEEEAKATMATHDLLATEKMAEKLGTVSLEVKGKISESGRLYASVNNGVIAKKLNEQGFKVRKDQVVIPETIKELGDYSVLIKLDHGLEAEVAVIVTE